MNVADILAIESGDLPIQKIETSGVQLWPVEEGPQYETPAFVQRTTNSASGSNPSRTITGVTPGNLLLAVSRANTSGNTIPSPSAGWTTILSHGALNGGTPQCVAYKVAASSSESVTMTTDGGRVYIVELSGVTTTDMLTGTWYLNTNGTALRVPEAGTLFSPTPGLAVGTISASGSISAASAVEALTGLPIFTKRWDDSNGQGLWTAPVVENSSTAIQMSWTTGRTARGYLLIFPAKVI